MEAPHLTIETRYGTAVDVVPASDGCLVLIRPTHPWDDGQTYRLEIRDERSLSAALSSLVLVLDGPDLARVKAVVDEWIT